jgi:small multidrug resistance pump
MPLPHPLWMSLTLVAAGLYNLAWGAFVVLSPQAIFRWCRMEEPRYPEFWQCIGMIVGVYAVGYLIAARDPLRHWPIVLVGFLGKLLGPIGFLDAALRGRLPWRFGLNNLTNDVIWLIPFALILHAAWKHHRPAAAP